MISPMISPTNSEHREIPQSTQERKREPRHAPPVQAPRHQPSGYPSKRHVISLRATRPSATSSAFGLDRALLEGVDDLHELLLLDHLDLRHAAGAQQHLELTYR